MNATHPLGNLIQAALDKNGWSTRDLQRRAEQLGFDMKHSNFSRLNNQELVSITGTFIHSLADVLQMSTHRVVQPDMVCISVEVPADQRALEDHVRDSGEFSTQERQTFQGIVETIRTLDSTTQESAADNVDHPAPNKRAGRRGALHHTIFSHTLMSMLIRTPTWPATYNCRPTTLT